MTRSSRPSKAKSRGAAHLPHGRRRNCSFHFTDDALPPNVNCWTHPANPSSPPTRDSLCRPPHLDASPSFPKRNFVLITFMNPPMIAFGPRHVPARPCFVRRKAGHMGLWPADGDKQRQLGSYLTEDHCDANFISPEIAQLARKEVAWREDDALIDQDRLYRNLLSSMPATFNLIGPLALQTSARHRRHAPHLPRLRQQGRRDLV